ncbi:MAG: hypothetical protein HY519_02515 [Candidatus Aenigmarchaeota archaeon]|nr:hypothetical protein [Candidatus Aenigmarchaeota archaeon]
MNDKILSMSFLLDTNFIADCAKLGIDVRSELMKFGKPVMFVMESSVAELRHKGLLTPLAAGIVRLCTTLPAKVGNVDKDLEIYAAEGYTVCTQDTRLRKRLHANGRKTVYIRQKRYLAAD